MRKFVVACAAAALVLSAQSRVSDRDVENLMKNLREDAKAFRPVFVSDVHKSAIRKTSREKDARALVQRFEKQTATLYDQFKRTKKADAELQNVRDSAQQIDALVSSLNLGGQTASRWQKVQSDLAEILNAFHMQPLRADSSDAGLNGPACEQAVGSERASRLVERCLAVSPATHPPCNARNSCALIIDEIKRSCALLAANNPPSFCSEYR